MVIDVYDTMSLLKYILLYTNNHRPCVILSFVPVSQGLSALPSREQQASTVRELAG